MFRAPASRWSVRAFALTCWQAMNCVSSKSACRRLRRPAPMPDSSVAPPPHRSGFVSIIGRPNAGKSTLLNALVGGKLAIVSEKPQTTRLAVQGVLTLPQAQIVFLDTPGIHHAATLLNKRLMDAVRASLQERDLLLFVADCSAPM